MRFSGCYALAILGTCCRVAPSRKKLASKRCILIGRMQILVTDWSFKHSNSHDTRNRIIMKTSQEAGPLHQMRPLLRDLDLIVTLTRREIVGRYRGSILGVLWSLLTPLFMLGVYTFVFSTVFKTRWTSGEGNATAEFAVMLFAGLLVYQLFAEVVNRAPSLIVANANYVKRVVFPLQILPVVALGSALFHMLAGLAVLVVFIIIVHGLPPPTAVLLPLVLAPYCLAILGLAWLLASLGVFIRDINQVLAPIVTALMFLSPIFFPLDALPESVRRWVAFNPLALPVEQTRDVLIAGTMPNFVALGLYTLAAIVVAVLGYLWFQKTRKGFADVL